jgi:ribosomal protein S11
VKRFGNTKEIVSQDFVVIYIINISFLKANTTIHVSDIQGNLKLFYSAGSVDLTGKQKKKRRIAVSKLISLLLKKATFLGQKPVALHLNNVNFYKNLIVRKLKRNLYIKIIKIFNQTPYNGCRKRKLRRKKYTKKFK